MALKAWRELISPHRDVLEGTFQESEFVADLTKVAKVLIDSNKVEGPFYIGNPFNQEPDFGVTSINYDIDSLLNK